MRTSMIQAMIAPWKGSFLSADYLFVRAVALVGFFLVAHAFGLREYTTFVSGTTGHPEVSMRLTAFYGMTYLALYFGCVVGAPILVIAAGILKLAERRSSPRSPARGEI